MSLKRICGVVLGLVAARSSLAAWPNGPLVTSGRWITDSAGNTVTYAGVNWPGAADTMLPEGLQYQSIESIVSKIKGIGINSIRLTYAIEMIDQIQDNGGTDIPIKTAFTNALGQDDGTAIYNKVISNNPTFSTSTTRLQVSLDAQQCPRLSPDLTNSNRYLTLLQQSARNRKYTSTWTTTFRKPAGAVPFLMETPGGVTRISPSPTGRVDSRTWRTM